MAKKENAGTENTEISAAEAKKIAKRAASKAKKALKKTALEQVLAFVLDNATEQVIIDAANSLKPGRTVVTGISATIADYMVENGEANEDTLWAEFKLGRAEMRKTGVNLIKKAKTPADRLWISFDPETGVYTLAGKGADVPAGWTGYRPVEVEDVEIDE